MKFLRLALLTLVVALGLLHKPQAASASACFYSPTDRRDYSCFNKLGYGVLNRSISFTTSYMANTFGGTSNQWMPTQQNASTVLSDGTVYQGGYYDENGHNIVALKNGAITAFSTDLHGFGLDGSNAIASDGTYVYFGITSTNFGSGTNACGKPNTVPSGQVWNSIVKYNLTLGTRLNIGQSGTNCSQLVVSQTTTAANEQISGLAVANGQLYVSDQLNNQVDIYNASTLALVAQVSVTAPGQIHADSSGNFWVVSGGITNIVGGRLQNSSGYQLLAFTSSGSPISAGGITLASSSIIGGMCADPSGDLLIADLGPDSNIKVFSNPLTSPLQIGTIGTTGGFAATPVGQVGPMRFIGPTGCGFDASGNFYVGQTAYILGGEVDAYNGTSPTATRLWTASSQSYIDTASYDPNTGYAYTNNGKYLYNPSATSVGTEATWVATTTNQFSPEGQDDPRYHDNTGGPLMRTIQGHLFAYNVTQNGTSLEVYKMGSDNLFHNSFIYNAANFRTWPNAPAGYNFSWLWTDTSGTGVIASGTYASPAPAVAHTTTLQQIYVDTAGNIWRPWLQLTGQSVGGFVTEYPFLGIDSNGNPEYTPGSAVTTALPSSTNISSLYYVAYDASTDTMYADGFPNSSALVNQCANGVGMNLAAISNWSTSPTTLWTFQLPYNCTIVPGNGALSAGPTRITEAGKYLFVSNENPAVVYVYAKSDGNLVGQLFPNNASVSQTGDYDQAVPVQAIQISAHRYEVFAEDDGRNKVIIYHVTAP